MPKKFKKRSRGGASARAKRLKQFPNPVNELYVAQIKKASGDGNFVCVVDTPVRLQTIRCILRGSMRNKLYVNPGDLILVQIPTYNVPTTEKPKEVFSYTQTHATKKPTKKVELPQVDKAYITYGPYSSSDRRKMIKEETMSDLFLKFHKNKQDDSDSDGFEFEVDDI